MNWISVKEQMPKPDRSVFAMCDIDGKQVPIRAVWIPDKFKEDEGDYDGDSIYDESQDKYFWPEGWYEWDLCEETHYFVIYPVTHWLEIAGPEVKQKDCDKCMFHERYGNATIELCKPTKDNPFNRVDLKHIDFGFADNIYVVEEPEDCCEWKYNCLDSYWVRKCCSEPYFLSPSESFTEYHLNFCPNCGRKIKEVK